MAQNNLENIKQFIKKKHVSWAAKRYIKMISEGSCDTEDRSNNAENLPTGINYALKSQIENILNYNISEYCWFTVFLINKSSLGWE